MLISVTTFAQKAKLKATVTDFSKSPLNGEQVMFVGESTGKTVEAVSGKDGTFTVELEGGDTYLIKLKSIGEAKDYNKIEVPELQEGAQYGTMQMGIMISQPSKFTLDNVHFDTGKASLRKDSYKELNDLYRFLKLKPEIKILVAGHTDNTGNSEQNKTLSENRANAVKSFLIKKGIAANRIQTKGYGDTQPVAENATAAGRQKNRRTEVHIQ